MTGRRRTLMSAIFNATSSRSSSSKQYFTSALIISRTLVSADLPAATARIAMSRSVIIPTSRSFSPTGSDPQSSFAIRHAASRMDWSGLVTLTSLLITWLTCMGFLLLWLLKHRLDKRSRAVPLRRCGADLLSAPSLGAGAATSGDCSWAMPARLFSTSFVEVMKENGAQFRMFRGDSFSPLEGLAGRELLYVRPREGPKHSRDCWITRRIGRSGYLAWAHTGRGTNAGTDRAASASASTSRRFI